MTKTDAATDDGSVFYAEENYAGLFRRFVVLIVDFGVILIANFVASTVSFVLLKTGKNVEAELMLSWLGLTYVYLAVLKPSRVRTAGYWISGVRIVNHKGERPSVFRMTWRLFLWILGPLNPLVDFFWLSGDRHRQTLRDKFAGTYVILRDSVPIGRGRRRAAYYNVMGATFIFWEIYPERCDAPKVASNVGN